MTTWASKQASAVPSMKGSLRLAPINIIIISLAYNTRSLLLPTILGCQNPYSLIPAPPPFCGPSCPLPYPNFAHICPRLMLTIGFSQSTSLLLASGPGGPRAYNCSSPPPVIHINRQIMNAPLVTSLAGSHSGPITRYTYPPQQTSLYTLCVHSPLFTYSGSKQLMAPMPSFRTSLLWSQHPIPSW